MKKIVPFNNVLEFNTDVKEITAISLEHEINQSPNMISGVFYISGEYKIAEGLLDKEKFNFELPFDIALSNDYRQDTLIVDIDDFRYELITDNNLKVNIDLYIDGEVEERTETDTLEFLDKELPEDIITITEDLTEESHKDTANDTKEIISQEELETESERLDLLKEMLVDDNKEKDEMPENININFNNNNEIENENTNFLEPQGEENYVTYRVYKVLESDTLDTILAKYNITKEQLRDYNNIENITPGDKLIIPTNEK